MHEPMIIGSCWFGSIFYPNQSYSVFSIWFGSIWSGCSGWSGPLAPWNKIIVCLLLQFCWDKGLGPNGLYLPGPLTNLLLVIFAKSFFFKINICKMLLGFNRIFLRILFYFITYTYGLDFSFLIPARFDKIHVYIFTCLYINDILLLLYIHWRWI